MNENLIKLVWIWLVQICTMHDKSFWIYNSKLNNKEQSTFEKIIVDGRPTSSGSSTTQKSRATTSPTLRTFIDSNQACEICWNEPSDDNFVRFENCQHNPHLSCKKTYLNSVIKIQALSIKCPDSEYSKNIYNIRKYLVEKDLQKFWQAWESQDKKEVPKFRTSDCNFAIILDGKSHVYCLGCFNSHILSGGS